MDKSQLANSQAENAETQDIADKKSTDAQLLALREKVARAIIEASDAYDGLLYGTTLLQAWMADEAILAILEELSRIDLWAGLCSPTLVEADQDRFRAINRALLELFKEVA